MSDQRVVRLVLVEDDPDSRGSCGQCVFHATCVSVSELPPELECCGYWRKDRVDGHWEIRDDV